LSLAAEEPAFDSLIVWTSSALQLVHCDPEQRV
jgi:hypothetical protein